MGTGVASTEQGFGQTVGHFFSIGENKNIGSRVKLRQRLTLFCADEPYLWKGANQALELRAVAYHVFDSRQIQGEKRLDIFLNRHPADIQKDRAWIRYKSFVPYAQEIRIDTPRPKNGVSDALSRQFPLQW